VQFYDTVVMAYSQSVSVDNEAGASFHPPLLAIDDGNADVGTALAGGDEAHSGDDGQDVQSLSVGDSDADSAGSAEAKKGKGTKMIVDDDEPWDEADEEYCRRNTSNSLPRGMPTVVDESVEVRVREPDGDTERKRQRLDRFRPSA